MTQRTEWADDLCYIPTKQLCSLKDKLDDDFFPDDTESVFKQEVVTYQRIAGGIKRSTLVRTFIGNRHSDSYTQEIMTAGPSGDDKCTQ